MKYSYSKNIQSDFNDSEAKVRESLAEVGFGVLTEINMQVAFKQKLNLDYKNYKILGACNPQLAHRALDSESLIGILMPCNILVIDNEDGSTKIVFPDAESLLEITGNQQVVFLAKEVDKLLKKAFDSIE
ncbi:MAG: hypothetical protein CBD58_03850 [bacterium TMED198]|nr:MAG: hypothetical protein CBD58_03850 [bacterium TMED198]